MTTDTNKNIDNYITDMLSDMVTSHLRVAVNEYANKLAKKYDISAKDAMTVWDEMNPTTFSISEIPAGTGKVVKSETKRKYTRSGPAKTSGYRIFCNETRNDIKEFIIKNQQLEGKELFTETAKALGAAWKKLSDDEKKPYNDKAKEMNAEISDSQKSTDAVKKAPIKKAVVKKKETQEEIETNRRAVETPIDADEGRGEGYADEDPRGKKKTAKKTSKKIIKKTTQKPKKEESDLDSDDLEEED